MRLALVLTAFLANSALAEIYVTDGTSNGSPPNRISVWPDTADGNPPPARRIVGSRTQIGNGSNGLTDIITISGRQEILVANNSLTRIQTFALGANGDALPLRELLLNGSPKGLAHIPITDEIVTAPSNFSALLFYQRSASGTASTTRTISGSNTGIGPIPTDIVYLFGIDQIAVSDYVPGDPNFAKRIQVFERSASGNTAPIRVIQGPATQLSACNGRLAGMTTDNTGSDIIIGCFNQILTFAPTANGDIAPLRRIAGPATTLVTISDVAFLFGNQGQPSTLVVTQFNATTSVARFDANANGDVPPLTSLNALALFQARSVATEVITLLQDGFE